MPFARYDRSIYRVPGAIVLVGLWLVVSPWVVGAAASQSSRLNAIVTGILIVLLAAGNIWGAARSRVLSWLVVLLGAWAIIAPFGFGDQSLSLWRSGAAVDDLEQIRYCVNGLPLGTWKFSVSCSTVWAGALTSTPA